MSVENGVVISVFNKDYEVMSWNEQGEITQIEGMLTIAFLVVSSCFHKDSWKQLYLIIKIPYMVNMPTNKEMLTQDRFLTVNLDQYREWVKEVPKLKQRIKEFESENKSLKYEISLMEKSFNEFAERLGIKFDKNADEIIKKVKPFATDYKKKLVELEDLTKKVNGLQQENQTLKEKLGIVDSKWQFTRDLAERINPVTKKHESYNFPLGFKEGHVEHLRHPDDDKYMYEFDYWISFEGNKSKYEHYKMSVSLYDLLCKKSEEFKKIEKELEQEEKESKQRKFDIHELQTEEKIKDYFLQKGMNLRGKYTLKTIGFLLKTRGNRFEIDDFNRYCGFKDNRESRRQHINKLIVLGLIKPTENQRIYQNLI